MRRSVRRCGMSDLARGTVVFLFVIGWVTTSALAGSVTRPSAAEDVRLERGVRFRAILLDQLERAYQHDGSWPERLADTSDVQQLVYSRPENDVAAEPLVAAATVALHEDLGRHPDGVWVG